MGTNDFMGFMTIESDLTVSKALNGTLLHSLQKKISKANVLKSISFLITNFNNNFNAKGKLTNEQIFVLSTDLFELFKYESLEDVMLLFKYARQGKIGDGKDFKLDSQTVFHKWMPEYLELKAIEREKKVQQEKEKQKQVSLDKMNKKVAERLFKGVGEQNINHDRKGGGLGSRAKRGVLNEYEFYVDWFEHKIIGLSTEKLEKCLAEPEKYLKNPKDKRLLDLVRKEIDKR